MDFPGCTAPLDTLYHFELTNELKAPDEKKFGEEIDEIESKLAKAEESCRETSAKLYSYSASKREVMATHKRWATTIQSVDETVTQCDIRLKNLHHKLPFLPLASIGKNMRRIYRLQLSLESLTPEITLLNLLLPCETYAKAIVLYKATIEKCEEICEQSKNGEKTVKLETFRSTIIKEVESQRKTLHHLEGDLRTHTELVYQELQQFCEKALATGPLLQQIKTEEELLTDLITTNLSKLSLKGNPSKALLEKYQKTSSVALRKDLSLYLGGIEGKATQAANQSISHLIDQMTKLAKNLQQLQQEVEDCQRQIYQGNATNGYEALDLSNKIFTLSLNSYEQLLLYIRESLYSFLSTREIRIGLYYASRLSAYIREITSILVHFKNNLSDDNKQIIEALDSCYKCFDALEKSNTPSGKVQYLFFAARSVAMVLDLQKQSKIRLSPFNVRVITCLETTIARIGKELLCVKADGIDTTIWLPAVCGNYHSLPGSIIKGVIPESIQEYIVREVTHHSFFSQSPTSLKLDILLTTLNKKKKNKEEPQFIPSFQEIHDSYVPKSPKELVAIFCDIFSQPLIQGTVWDQYDEHISGYSQIIALLYEAKGFKNKISDREVLEELNQLINYVEKQLIRIQKDSQYELGSPLPPGEDAIKGVISRKKPDEMATNCMLLHLLSRALWLEGDVQNQASIYLRQYFSKSNDSCLPLQFATPLNYLIAAFILDLVYQGQSLSKFETMAKNETFTFCQKRMTYKPKIIEDRYKLLLK